MNKIYFLEWIFNNSLLYQAVWLKLKKKILIIKKKTKQKCKKINLIFVTFYGSRINPNLFTFFKRECNLI